MGVTSSLLISLSTAIVAQTHLKEYIVWAIEPTEKVGLHGADIIPVLEGFGCNAAAVSQAASQCHQCTKAQCMSLIGFGSSCSYQIGATLSFQRSTLLVICTVLNFSLFRRYVTQPVVEEPTTAKINNQFELLSQF